jgi:hypothetical protein
MNSMSDDINKEIKRALQVYTEYKAQGLFKTVWSPFNKVEAAYRSQQSLAFSTLMREAGFAVYAFLKSDVPKGVCYVRSLIWAPTPNICMV